MKVNCGRVFIVSMLENMNCRNRLDNEVSVFGNKTACRLVGITWKPHP